MAADLLVAVRRRRTVRARLGIVGHVRFMLELRTDHDQLVMARLIPHDQFPYSITLAVSVLLLMIGLFAIISMVGRTGPFH